MDSLFHNQDSNGDYDESGNEVYDNEAHDEHDDIQHQLFTPPRSKHIGHNDIITAARLSPSESSEPSPILRKTSPGFTAATSPTNTTLTDKSKSSYFLYTFPEGNTGNGTSYRSSNISNPSGMVIHTEYAKEAIEDPTWLDSDDDDDEVAEQVPEEGQEAENHHGKFRNRSLLNVTTTGSDSHVEEDSCAHSATSLPEKTWSMGSTGSSLSVGSCGFGKMSLSDSGISQLGGSLSLGSGRHSRGGRIMLSHIDVVDMGVESVSSGESNDYVFDYLYDLERRAYDLSDDEEEDGGGGGGGGGDHEVDDESGYSTETPNGEHGHHVLDSDDDLSLEEMDDNDNVDVDDDDEDDDDCNSSAYLPQHLMSPPRLSRRKMLQESVRKSPKTHPDDVADGTDDITGCKGDIQKDIVKEMDNGDIETEKDGFQDKTNVPGLNVPTDETSIDTNHNIEPWTRVVSPEKEDHPSENLDSKFEGVSSDTRIMINTMPPLVSPLSMSSIVSDGDVDDSGSSTDETNICSNCSPSAPKIIMDDTAGIFRGDVVLSILDCPGSKTRKKRQARKCLVDQSYPWGEHALKNTLSCVRSLRRDNRQLSPEQISNCSFSSVKCGKTSRARQVTHTGTVYSTPTQTKSLLSGSFRISSGSKSPHKSQMLETEGFEYLRNDDFESALSVFHEIHDIYHDHSSCYEEGSEEYREYESFKGLTVFNMGIIHLLNAEYTKALDCFDTAENVCNKASDRHQIDRMDLMNMKGHACYAMGKFDSAAKHWNSALDLLKMPTNQGYLSIMAELLNNLGCAIFEIGTCTKSVKFFKDSLQVQMNMIHEGNDLIYNSSLAKIATTRSNMGYVYLRMKHPTQAIELFEESLIDQNICFLPHHHLVLSTMEHLAISFVKKGSISEAIKIYSKILTAKIETQGSEHDDCITTLTKLSLLQVKRNDKEGSIMCMKKIQSCLSSKDPCETERFEKLMKASKASGLRAITVIGNN